MGDYKMFLRAFFNDASCTRHQFYANSLRLKNAEKL